jgi:spore coat protein F
MNSGERRNLAWHETLEMHELLAFQSIGLMKLKMGIRKISDPELLELYRMTINGLEMNINELIPFYSSVPVGTANRETINPDMAFYAGDLLALLKTSVRNYAIAITETATPELRGVLTNHLLRGIQGHERIFTYMLKKGLYPSYNLEQLLTNDLQTAQKALHMD